MAIMSQSGSNGNLNISDNPFLSGVLSQQQHQKNNAGSSSIPTGSYYNITSTMNWEEINNMISKTIDDKSYGINDNNEYLTKGSFNQLSDNISGIFGMPYQFSDIVDPPLNLGNGEGDSNIGRKFSEKIFSIMPILFLTPGEPVFMEGYNSASKQAIGAQLANALTGNDTDMNADYDEGRYYSFRENFTQYKKYANISLRALAQFMGISDIHIPIPGKNKTISLGNIDIEDFLNGSFVKMFGTQTTIPFFIDAENSISESFSNSTTESVIGQNINGFSQTAKEVQFMMGSHDKDKLLNSIGQTVENLGQNLASGLGELSDVMAGKTMFSRIANELHTIVSGGKIIFPEIWSDSEYDRSYDINIKLRSPDPDPVSIFLNIYMPIILLVSMAAPRQINNSSNSYESPFLVRATYKSIFSCDLGMISSLSINKGGPGNWNSMGHPTSADVTVNIKDLYSTMFISKRMGLISNTAQMDYLATLAGINLNEFEPLRIVKLAGNIIRDTPMDWADQAWGSVKSKLNKAASRLIGHFTDTRFL